MKKFAVAMMIAGLLLFLAGTFNWFDLIPRRNDNFVWLGIPMTLLGGVAMFTFYLKQSPGKDSTKKDDAP